MPAFKLNAIKPSVNKMAARVFARAAGLDFAEHDVFGGPVPRSSWLGIPRI
jgi:glutathione S-transferase